MLKVNLANLLLLKPRHVLTYGIRKLGMGHITKFIESQPHISELSHRIPAVYKKITTSLSVDYLYLICSETARITANNVLASVNLNKTQVIAEVNAGLGLISTELLERGVNRMRIYENCKIFQSSLQKHFNENYPERVEIFPYSFFDISTLEIRDRYDNQGRAADFFKNIPKKAWNDDPVLTIVGTMTSFNIFRYFIKSFIFQSSPMSYGRIQIFALMRAKHYKVLSATAGDGSFYQHFTVLFKLLFDYELLEVFERDRFLPWEKAHKKKSIRSYEADKMYLVKINFKKDACVPSEHFLGLYHFVKQSFSRGNRPVIQVMEKFVPGSGFNIIVPSRDHKHFPKEVNIYTKFNELTPDEILAIFQEMILHPKYKSSAFMSMINSSFLRTEFFDPYNMDAIEENVINKKMELEEKVEMYNIN